MNPSKPKKNFILSTTLLSTILTVLKATTPKIELGSKIQFPYSTKPYLRDIREYIKIQEGNIFDVSQTKKNTQKDDPIKFLDDRTKQIKKKLNFTNFAEFERNNFTRYSFGVVLTSDAKDSCRITNYQYFNISESCSEIRNIEETGQEILKVVYGSNALKEKYLMSTFTQYSNGNILVEDMKRTPYKGKFFQKLICE